MNNCPGFIKITFVQQSFVIKLVRVKNLMQYERKKWWYRTDCANIYIIYSWIPDGTRIIVIIERYVWDGWSSLFTVCLGYDGLTSSPAGPRWALTLSPDVELLFMQGSNAVSLYTGIIHYKSGRINQKHDTFHFTSIAQVSLTF